MWVIFALLDPDPESGSESTDPDCSVIKNENVKEQEGDCVLPAHSPTLENLFGNSRLVLSFRQGQVLVTLSN